QAFTDEAEQAAASDDVLPQFLWRTARAKAAALQGDPAAAESFARQALQLAGETDFLGDHGEARLVLAQALRLSRRTTEAAAEAERALALFEAKGIRPAAERAAALVVALGGSVPAGYASPS